MAIHFTVVVVDDLTGEIIDDDETVSWGIGGRYYEFDTSPEHAAEFREHLATYVSVSRRIGAGDAPYSRTVVAPTGRAAGRVREWAAGAGVQVSKRGPIPVAVLDAFDAARR